MFLTQGKNQAVINPGSFGVLSSSKPYETYCSEPPDHSYSELFVKMPGPMLRDLLPLMDDLCATSITPRPVATKMVNSVIETILAEGWHICEAQGRMFRSMLINALGVAALDAPEVNSMHESLCLNGHARVRMKATDFIEANLSNPLLDAAMVAHGCGVSLRRLHEAFASSITTVAMLIRQMRMEHCKSDLTNPAMQRQSAIQIAMRWGFSSSASFTRSYRAHFGRTPSDERRACHLGESGNEGDFPGVGTKCHQDSIIALR